YNEARVCVRIYREASSVIEKQRETTPDLKVQSTYMAPRRHANGGHGGGGGGGGLLENGGGGIGTNDPMDNLLGPSQTTRCCTPTGECLRGDTLIRLNALHDAVKVTCNNDNCPIGQFMHRECFDAWEQTVLTYLKSCGRARSWSERQRHQNLWTKKGYDLAFKACGCRCGRGHLKKDLDWMPPGLGNVPGNRPDENEAKKKKRRNRQNTRPSLAVSAGPPNHGNHVVAANGRGTSEAQMIEAGRGRAGSLSSSTGSSSPPATSEPSVSPLHQPQAIMKKKSKVDFFSDRARSSVSVRTSTITNVGEEGEEYERRRLDGCIMAQGGHFQQF
ncbi:Headcase protein, partial [Trachymyrmex septentrionalis]